MLGSCCRFGMIASLLVPLAVTRADDNPCQALALHGLAQRGFDGWACFATSLPGDGDEVLFAGDFRKRDGQVFNGVARWDGSKYHPLGSGLEGSRWASASDAVVDKQGSIYVCGGFTTAGGVAANHIAKWQDGSWHALGDGVPNTADFMCTTPAGGLAVLSNTSPDPETLKMISTLSMWDGRSWTRVSFEVAQNPWEGSVYIRDMLVRSNGEVVICGFFDSIDGAPAKGVARWDGRAWQAFDAGLWTVPYGGAWYSYEDIAELANDRLLLGGYFVVGDSEYRTNASLAEWIDGNWRVVEDMPLTGVAKIEPIGDTAFVLSGYDILGYSCISRWDGYEWKTATTSEYRPADSIAVRQSGEVCGGKHRNYLDEEAWMRVRFETPPIIERQPVPATFNCRSIFYPAATVVVAPELQDHVSYLWRRDGIPIDWQNSADLNLLGPDGDDCGIYDCVISNGCGQVVSDAVEIRIVGCGTADWNHDGIINAADLEGFLSAFQSGKQSGWPFYEIWADFNRDGFLDFEDFDEFVRVFEHGC